MKNLTKWGALGLTVVGAVVVGKWGLKKVKRGA